MPVVIDLTMEISQDLPVFPGSPAPRFIPWERISDDGYNLELLLLSSHSGTHLDAPRHFLDGSGGIDSIPADRLVTYAVLIRTKGRTVTKRDVVAFEAEYGSIPAGRAVVFATGWSRDTGRKDYFAKNPGISVSAAEYIAGKEVSLVGIDSPSIDPGASKKFPAHRVLLGRGIPILENLVNLEELDGPAFILIALPLRLKNATGSPVRAIAL